MTGRNVDRVLMLAGLLMLVALLLAAQTEKANAEMYDPEPYAGGRVVFVEVVRVETRIVDASPDCEEDESWVAVHYETPNAREDRRGVTRMCRATDDIIMDGINELILDGTLIWEWDI